MRTSLKSIARLRRTRATALTAILVVAALVPLKAYSAPAESALGSSETAHAIVAKLQREIDNAPAIRFDIETSSPPLGTAGKPDPSHTYHVVGISGKSAVQLQRIYRGAVLIGVLSCTNFSGIYYDAQRNQYLTFPAPVSQAATGKDHALMDETVGNNDIGNIFDSTGAFVDLAGQYDRDSPVVYSLSRTSWNGQQALKIKEKTTGSGSPMEESVVLSPQRRLLDVSISFDYGGRMTLVSDERYKTFVLLRKPLSSATFSFKIPATAKPMKNAATETK